MKQLTDVRSEMDSKLREMLSLQQKMNGLMKSWWLGCRLFVVFCEKSELCSHRNSGWSI